MVKERIRELTIEHGWKDCDTMRSGGGGGCLVITEDVVVLNISRNPSGKNVVKKHGPRGRKDGKVPRHKKALLVFKAQSSFEHEWVPCRAGHEIIAHTKWSCLWHPSCGDIEQGI